MAMLVSGRVSLGIFLFVYFNSVAFFSGLRFLLLHTPVFLAKLMFEPHSYLKNLGHDVLSGGGPEFGQSAFFDKETPKAKNPPQVKNNPNTRFRDGKTKKCTFF